MVGYKGTGFGGSRYIACWSLVGVSGLGCIKSQDTTDGWGRDGKGSFDIISETGSERGVRTKTEDFFGTTKGCTGVVPYHTGEENPLHLLFLEESFRNRRYIKVSQQMYLILLSLCRTLYSQMYFLYFYMQVCFCTCVYEYLRNKYYRGVTFIGFISSYSVFYLFNSMQVCYFMMGRHFSLFYGFFTILYPNRVFVI